MDLEKRLSNPRALAGAGSVATSGSSGGSSNVPQLQLPLPPPGSRLAPPRSPRSSSSQPHTPTSLSAGLQSPRLSYVPVSPIDAAFRFGADDDDADDNDDGRERTWHGYGGNNNNNGDGSDNADAAAAAAAGGLTIGLAIGRTPSSRSARTGPRTSVVYNANNNNNNGNGNGKHVNSGRQEDDPVSPIDPDEEEDDDTDSKRLSFVSAPSVAGDGPGDADLVSPVSPDDHEPGSGDRAVSPITVSSVESRRVSWTDR